MRSGARTVSWAEIFTGAILVVAIAAMALRAPGRPAVLAALEIHLAMLAGFAAAIALLVRFASARPWAGGARALIVVLVMFTLYTSLGVGGFEVMPWTGDAALSRADLALTGGVNAHLAVDARVSYGVLEFFAFFYGLYMPVLYMSIVLGIVGRPDGEREEFFTGFAFLYACAFLGYLLLPSHGPVVYYASQYSAPLHGGLFHGIILRAVDSTGGNLGAFPSLHVGSTAFSVLFDARHNRLRSLTYFPILLMIAAATVVLRYHYLVDLIAGAGLAWIALRVARRLG